MGRSVRPQEATGGQQQRCECVGRIRGAHGKPGSNQGQCGAQAPLRHAQKVSGGSRVQHDEQTAGCRQRARVSSSTWGSRAGVRAQRGCAAADACNGQPQAVHHKLCVPVARRVGGARRASGSVGRWGAGGRELGPPTVSFGRRNPTSV